MGKNKKLRKYITDTIKKRIKEGKSHKEIFDAVLQVIDRRKRKPRNPDA